MAQNLWYKDAIFYAIDIPSFQDGNGDGIGDFQGATARLDYLAELGINCIWLLPFYRSPFRDNGYDIQDYYSLSEPQLKFANPAIREEVFKIMDFWLSFGIAGFRMDAASHIVESENLQAAIPEKPHTILKQVRQFLEKRRPGGILLGKSNVRAAQLEEYFGQGDEINVLFNFPVNSYLFLAMARRQKDPLQYCLGLLPSIPTGGHWANFLRNLDELDLKGDAALEISSEPYRYLWLHERSKDQPSE
jgi:glycosidase